MKYTLSLSLSVTRFYKRVPVCRYRESVSSLILFSLLECNINFGSELDRYPLQVPVGVRSSSSPYPYQSRNTILSEFCLACVCRYRTFGVYLIHFFVWIQLLIRVGTLSSLIFSSKLEHYPLWLYHVFVRVGTLSSLNLQLIPIGVGTLSSPSSRLSLHIKFITSKSISLQQETMTISQGASPFICYPYHSLFPTNLWSSVFNLLSPRMSEVFTSYLQG